jgi:hypothetical protein
MLLLKALAADSNSRPRTSCPAGQAAVLIEMAARMYRGQAPIGALPSQHPAFLRFAKCRGVRMQHCMQNSTSTLLAKTCDLNGRSTHSTCTAKSSSTGSSSGPSTAGAAPGAPSAASNPPVTASLVGVHRPHGPRPS